jgi:hypothetical protein
MRFAVALAALAAAAGQRITIQPCELGFTAQNFTLNQATGVLTQAGQCLGFDSTSLILEGCDGSAAQQWTFHGSDGTVESVGSPGQCWNVDVSSRPLGAANPLPAFSGLNW